MEGKKYRVLGEDCQAVSEVVGQVLMIAIVVLAFSSIAAVIFSSIVANPPHTPHTNLQERIDPISNELYIYHVGGEAIDLKDINIILVCTTDIHTRAEFNLSSKSGFNHSAKNGVLMLGDSVVINPTNEGINLGTGDITMFLIYTPSRQVIQRVTLHDGK